MKRIAVLLVCLSLLCLGACSALAATADAAVVAKGTIKITAPYAGTLLPFDYAAGDSVAAGDTLFSLQTTPVLAPQNGTVAAVFAHPGSDAAGVSQHYGAVVVLEPEHPLYLAANTSSAYDDDDNRYIHAGEFVWLKNGSDKGTGTVTSVSAPNYVVEILSGPFDLDDNVRIFRDSNMTASNEIGKGKVSRYPDISVTASGRVTAVHATAGQSIAEGSPLFEVVDPSAPVDAGTDIASPASGVLSSLYVTSGTLVYRGQLLCEITDLANLELRCEIDELDYPSLHVGDTLSYTLDAFPGRTFQGTVSRIGNLGSARQNASYYDVRLTLPPDVPVRPGMNGTVTLKD